MRLGKTVDGSANWTNNQLGNVSKRIVAAGTSAVIHGFAISSSTSA
jgi:hypothetical protein